MNILKLSILIGVFLLSAFAIRIGSAHDLSVPEILYERKPIDPQCIYAAMRQKGKSINLKEGCPEFSGDGFSGILEKHIHNSDHQYGYDFTFEDGIHGGFYYQVIGKISEGLVLNIYYSTGGSGHFSDLGIFRRNGNILSQIRTIKKGDRCSGGVDEAKIEKRNLFYSYNITPLELYQHYMPHSAYKADLGSGFANCGAKIHMRGEIVDKVELIENAIFPECFRKEYQKQIAKKKSLSDKEAKVFFQKFDAICDVN